MLDIPAARSLLQRTRPRRHAHGYPTEVHAPVVALVRAKLADGVSLNAIASELGVHGDTLQRWLARTPATEPAFVPVVVQQTLPPAEGVCPDAAPAQPQPTAAPTPPHPATSSTRLTLTSPSGFRLDGLSMHDAIHALRQLS